MDDGIRDAARGAEIAAVVERGGDAADPQACQENVKCDAIPGFACVFVTT